MSSMFASKLIKEYRVVSKRLGYWEELAESQMLSDTDKKIPKFILDSVTYYRIETKQIRQDIINLLSKGNGSVHLEDEENTTLDLNIDKEVETTGKVDSSGKSLLTDSSIRDISAKSPYREIPNSN